MVPAVVAAPQPQSKLVWFVDPAAVVSETRRYDGPAATGILALGLASTMPQAFTRALLKAGYGVVEDRGAPHDVTARITITTEYVYGGAQSARTTASVKALALDATLLDDVTVAVMATNIRDYPDILAALAVNKIGVSGAVAAFGTAKERSKELARNAPAASSQPQVIATATEPLHPAAPSPGALVQGAPQPAAYAIVIGIEKYSSTLPTPTGAHADAQRFADLARTSLGVPPDHVQTLFDEQATKGSIERALASVQLSVQGGGRVYFYFSGHGAPDTSAAGSGTSFIVPTDGDPQFLDATAISMKEILTKLGQSKARDVLAVVDSCFSGAGGRSVLPPGARPIVRVKEESAPPQLALFSASSGNEISGPTEAGDGGLFTQYVLQGLGTAAADANGDGQVSLTELSQWVAPRVAREAKKANRDQNPALTVGKGLAADTFMVEWGVAAK